jgi:glycosyltransferase involved in cell wall biosynthesis
LPQAEVIPGLVSVIMPSFNHETFVAEAMHSVIDQSYRDIEFLIIDDKSTDSTLSVIHKVARTSRFSRRFRRLAISCNRQNVGAHHSLNLGLAASRGEFVTFINSDDAYEPERLRILTSCCDAADAPFFAYSTVRLIDAVGGEVKHHELKDVLEVAAQSFEAVLPTVTFGFLRYQLTGSTGNIFVNRSLLSAIGGFSPLKYCHDWEFVLRAVTVVEPYRASQTAYLYRLHDGNTFNDLQHLAAQDTAAALGGYFQRITRGRVSNPIAPTPENWPYVFEMIVRQFGVYEAWRQVARSRIRYASWS